MSTEIRRIAVVGPGLMGLGIAQVVAAAGIDVLLVGRNATAAAAGHARFLAGLARQASRGRLGPDVVERVSARVASAHDDREMSSCDAAVESVDENRGLKESVLARVGAVLPAHAWIATNTSGLPIGGLASALQRPERLVGLHFFSPVERMKLVEVVRGSLTSSATIAEALAFVAHIGQTPIVVRDGPGFFTSRVFAAYLDEALALLDEGVAPESIEAAALANGRPIGPLAVLDEVSLALNLQQAEQARADGLADRHCRPLAHGPLARMVALGRAGRREGGGFYDHPAGQERRLWEGLADVFPRASRQPPDAVIAARLRCAEALEALRCLEESVLASADDADAGSLLGLGYPAATGGVLRGVEAEGLDRFVATCDALASDRADRFRPTAWLRDVAAAGRGLAAWRGARANV